MIRLGTRSSDLALTQSAWVADLLRARGLDVELVPITTTGDRSRAPLALMGSVGVFAAALRTALLNDECDLAVHSLKDLPVAPVEGLTIAAIPGREDPSDVLVLAPHLSEVPDGARIGTGSPRRAAQVRALYPTCQIADIRGNVPTRIARATDGDLDAVVLAAAGLNRLSDRLTEALADRTVLPLAILPAAAQGALAVECRTADAELPYAASPIDAATPTFTAAPARHSELAEALAAIDDAAARACITAERAVLAELEAGCAAPIGTYAELTDGDLHLTAAVFATDGSASVTATMTGHPWDAAAIGQDLARALLDRGADAITDIDATLDRHRLDALPALAPTATGALTGRTILVPRPEDDRIVDAIRAAGAAVIAHPMTRIEPLDVEKPAVPDATHLAITSPRTVERLVDLGLITQIRDAGLIVAAVGPASAAAAERAGLAVAIHGTHDAATLATAMIAATPARLEPRTQPHADADAQPAANSPSHADAGSPSQPTPHTLSHTQPTAGSPSQPTPHTPHAWLPASTLASDTLANTPTAAGSPSQPTPHTPHAWLPASALASDTLANTLTAAGWHVARTALYTSLPVESVDQDVADAWRRGLIDAVVITAPSVADALRIHLGPAGPGTAVIAIGEPSAKAIRADGGIVAATAPKPTPAAIVTALSTTAKD